ncbi:MAG: GC-type dockerin domain-anchored protein, partial [Planctomycetota bacterium]
ANRFDWEFSFLGLPHGFHTLTAAAYELTGTGGAVEHTFFVDTCLADVNMDGVASPADFNAWVLAFNSGDERADQNEDGSIDPSDFNAWVLNFNAGCN